MGKKFTFHVSEWIADMVYLSAEESGVYINLCLQIIDSKHGFIDADYKQIGRRCRCSTAKARKIVEQLISRRLGNRNEFRIEDGKLYSSKCSEILAEMERRDRRLPWPEWGRRRTAVFARDQHRCVYCGTEEGPFECDHIVPVSRGGTNDLDNLATACVACNRDKRDSTIEEWRPDDNQLN